MRISRKNNARLRALMVTAAVLVAAILTALLAGCGGQPLVVTTTPTGATTSGTTSTNAFQRQQIGYFRGLTEPRSEAWQDLVTDANHVRADNVNTVTIDPTVLIDQRAGGKARVALTGSSELAPGLVDDLHSAGLAAHLAPTTNISGFPTQIEPSDAMLNALNEDTLKWAQTAEEKQAELFSPLDRYNLVLGTDAADKWSQAILPQIRDKYKGPVAAMVVPDIVGPPPAGTPHDFEKLSYKGYDYLIVDIIPHQTPFDQAAFLAQTSDILARAVAIMERDGLKGIMVRVGSWREQEGIDPLDGPELGDQGQADLTARIFDLIEPQVMPQVKGVFFEGWTLPGRGARDHPVEPVINNFYSKTKSSG